MNRIPTRVHLYDKKRALHLADYLAEYGIEVEEVNISTDGRCEIVCFGNHDEIQNTVAQFNEDYYYGKS